MVSPASWCNVPAFESMLDRVWSELTGDPLTADSAVERIETCMSLP
jgi:hypothetical protein